MNPSQSSDEAETKSLSYRSKLNSYLRKNIEDARMRLDKEVEELKNREASGEKAPRDALQRILESRNARDNIICIADVFKEVAKDWEEKSKRVQKFAAHLWEKVAIARKDKCHIHGSEYPVDRDLTFSKSWQEQKVRIVYGDCLECKQGLIENLVNEKWKKMGIPDKLLHETFDTYMVAGPGERGEKIRPAGKVFDHIKANKSGVIIIRGWVGTGKSHLGVACIKEIGDGLFVTQADLIGELRQTYSDNTSQDYMIDKYRKTKVFVLDELSKEVRGTDIPAFLYRILSYRYDKNLLTVITSNESLEDILEILGPKLTDRIRDNNTVVTCEWDSYRGKK